MKLFQNLYKGLLIIIFLLPSLALSELFLEIDIEYENNGSRPIILIQGDSGPILIPKGSNPIFISEESLDKPYIPYPWPCLADESANSCGAMYLQINDFDSGPILIPKDSMICEDGSSSCGINIQNSFNLRSILSVPPNMKQYDIISQPFDPESECESENSPCYL